MLSDAVVLAPYVGVYADFYFSSDDATARILVPTEFVEGWSARVTSGLSVSTQGGARFAFGGEVGGIGNNFTVWTLRGRASVPF